MAPSLHAFDHAHIFVANRSAAETWYKQVLGFEPVAALRSWAADGGPLILKDLRGAIHLALFERDAGVCRSTIAFRTTALEYRRWKQHLHQWLGGRVTEEENDALMSLSFADPDGNPYAITTHMVPAVKHPGYFVQIEQNRRRSWA